MDDSPKQKETEGEVEVEMMAVSMKPAPVFTGSAAKKLIERLENPKDNTAIFQKCIELAKAIREKK